MDEFDIQLKLKPFFEEAEKLGLYITGDPSVTLLPKSVDTMLEAAQELIDTGDVPDPFDLVDQGKMDALLSCTFVIGQVAWSDRVLEPEKHKDRREFEKMLGADRFSIEDQAAINAILEFEEEEEEEE